MCDTMFIISTVISFMKFIQKVLNIIILYKTFTDLVKQMKGIIMSTMPHHVPEILLHCPSPVSLLHQTHCMIENYKNILIITFTFGNQY